MMNGNTDARENGLSRADEQFVRIYDSLRRLAQKKINEHSASGDLQPTALVHDVYLKLKSSSSLDDASTTKHFAYAATTMRRLLVSYFRKNSALKRGGDLQRTVLDENQLVSMRNGADVLALDDALNRLREIDEVRASIVEMRVFGGMTNKEIAIALGISEGTVKNKWAATCAWLRKEFAEGS